MTSTRRLRSASALSMSVVALFMGAGTASADSGPEVGPTTAEVGLTTAIESIDAALLKYIPDEGVAFLKLGDVVLRLEEFLEETEPR